MSENTSQGARYLSVDFYRGATIAFMIIVNTPGTWRHVYPPLQHAVWHGCTPTDLVFPSFMFIIGVSMWFSFARYNREWSAEAGKKVLKRTALLFLFGVLMYQLPFFWRNWDSARILGVLQRLALGYGIAAVLVLNFSRNALLWIAAALLLGYWGIMHWMGLPGGDPYLAENSAVLRLDKWLFGEAHLYNGEVNGGVRMPFDPEGLLSTLPSVVTVLLGWLAGSWMTERKNQKELLVRDLLVFGLMLGFAGLAWDFFFPINKKLWTSSYVLYVGGLSMIFLSASIWVIDMLKWRKGVNFFLVFGANSLFAYLLSEVLVIFWYNITWDKNGETINLQEWIYQTIFEPIGGGNFSSFLFAIGYMLLCWVVCRWLYVRNIFIKL